MASIVDIIIRTKQQGSGARDTEDSLLKLGKTVAVAAAAITAFGIAANKAFDLAKQGAVVVQTAESFDLLLDKVGAAPDLLNQLNNAAGGTISQMGIMSSTATLLAGASGDLATQLANATPQLLEIARAANKLNPSLGDTTFLYQSLATGIKRASPLILDNLGLTIKVGEANAAYAAALGKTVEQLTAEEQKQALLNETLRAGGVLIDQVGGSLDSAVDSYSRFEAAAEDAANAAKAGLHGAFEPALGVFEQLFKLTTVSADAMEMFGASISSIPGHLKLANGEIVSLAELIRMYNGRMAQAESATDGWAAGLLAAGDAAGEMGDAASASMDELQGMTDQMILSALVADGYQGDLSALAVQMGFISESEAILIEREKELERQRQAGIISATQYALSVSSLRQALEDLPESKRIEILLDIQGMGGLSQLQRALGGSGITGQGGAGADFARASGGFIRSDGITSVGEQGEEGVVFIGGIPYVIPADEWRMMKGAGVRPGKGRQFGGPLLDGVARPGAVRGGSILSQGGRTLGSLAAQDPDYNVGPFDAISVGGFIQKDFFRPGGGGGGGTGGGGTSQQSTQQQAAAVQQVATEAAVSAATQAASGALQASQSSAFVQIGAQLRAGIDGIGQSIRGSNDVMIQEIRGLRDDIRRLERAQEDMVERVVDLA